MEQLCNDPSTTLSLAIDGVTTTAVVTSATGYPTSGNFRIRIDDELLLVTGVSGTTWTVTRGIEGTTATAHSANAPVNAYLTAGGSAQYVSDTITAYVNRGWPASVLTAPIPGSFSWLNQGSSTVQTTAGIGIQSPLFNGVNIRAQTIPLTSGSNYTVTMAFTFMNAAVTDNGQYGIFLYNSTSGKLLSFHRQFFSGSPVWAINTWNSTSSFNATTNNIGSNYNLATQGVLWARIGENGTNRVYSLSADGVLFSQVYSEAAGTWITPTHAGIGMSPSSTGSTSLTASITLLSYTQTSP